MDHSDLHSSAFQLRLEHYLALISLSLQNKAAFSRKNKPLRAAKKGTNSLESIFLSHYFH
jgi:hypothetical protein